MSEISTIKVLDGITLALREAYPDSQIESDSIEQGVKPPAFLISLESAEQFPWGRNGWKRQLHIDIHYFPQTGRKECYTVADRLYTILELLTLPNGELLRGTEMSFKIIEGVLHFLVSYDCFVYRKKEETMMGALKYEQKEESIWQKNQEEKKP